MKDFANNHPFITAGLICIGFGTIENIVKSLKRKDTIIVLMCKSEESDIPKPVEKDNRKQEA